MSLRDVTEQNTYIQSIAPAAITATTTGSAVDVTGYEGVEIVVEAGVITAADASNYMTFTVTYTTDDTNYTALDSGDYISPASWDRIINATTEGSATYRFGIKPSVANISKIKVVATETGTFNGIFGASVRLANPLVGPVTS